MRCGNSSVRKQYFSILLFLSAARAVLLLVLPAASLLRKLSSRTICSTFAPSQQSSSSFWGRGLWHLLFTWDFQMELGPSAVHESCVLFWLATRPPDNLQACFDSAWSMLLPQERLLRFGNFEARQDFTITSLDLKGFVQTLVISCETQSRPVE